MKYGKIVIGLFLTLALTACGGPTLDLTNDQTRRDSIDVMAQESEYNRREIEDAIMLIGRQHSTRVAIRESVDGRTVKQLMSQAEKIRAEQQSRM